MTGREFEETNEKITRAAGETPAESAEFTQERRTEAILRRAAAWETETPEPVGLAYRALTKKGVLRGEGRQRFSPIRHWWGIGTLGVASVLAVLIYTHPISFDTPSAHAPTPEPTPLTQKATSAPSGGATAEKVMSPTTLDAGKAKQNEAKRRAAKRQAPSTVSVEAKHPRSFAHRGVGRRGPETMYRPRNRTFLAHNRQHSRRHETAHPAAPQSTGKETMGASQLAANPSPLDAAPSDYRILVPIVLTRESDDGSEIIATPAVMELAYEPMAQK